VRHQPNLQLADVGAAWDPDPSAGEWIAPLLGPFGQRLDHAVPRGYERYAVVPVPEWDDPDANPLSWLETLLDVLEPITGDQPVHVGYWDGWGWMYRHGEDAATAPGMSALVARTTGWRARLARLLPRPARRLIPPGRQLREACAAAQAELGAARVEHPAAAPLQLPHRDYYLWTGPLRSATVFERWPDPPSLIWPEDRSWFVGAPIYTREAAVGGDATLIDAVLARPELHARAAQPETVLDIDD